jgi:hypothetical protein
MSANIKASVDGTQAIIGVGGVDKMTVSNAGIVTANSFVGNVTGNITGNVTGGGTFSGNASSATALATGSSTARSLANRFADIINVKDFGAVGDGVADDTAAIQGALTFALTSGKRSVVFLPSGNYRVTNTLTISSIDSGIIGSGSGIPTRITADHSNGPVIKIIGERQCVKYLTITSSASRTSGSSGTGLNTNCGILHCPGTGLSRYVEIKKVSIGAQPSHGLLAVGTINSSEYSLLNITNNIGHGIVFANGQTIGEPSIISASGLTILSTSNIFDNGGNGIVIGEPTELGNIPVRIDINNCEFGRNATNAATRKSLFQADVFGRQIVFNTCAFTSVSEFTGGIKIGGSGLFLKANRFLDVSKAISVESYAGFTTQGVTIQEVHVADGTTQLIPAIDINDLAQDVYVDSSNTFSIGALVSKNRNQKNSSKKIIYKVTDQIVNNSSTLTGDSDLLFFINKDERKVFRFVIFYQGNVSAGLKLNIARPASSNIFFCTPSSTIINLSNVISIQETMGVGGIITAGCDATQIRSIELTGTVVTSGLPGNVQLFWSQNTAHASDLKIYGQSFLEFI